MLTVSLLGPPLVSLNGEPQNINRRGTRALLFFLVAKREPVDRSVLCDFLWGGEGDEKTLRKKLRGALNNLKRSFPDVDLIRTYHDMVGVVPHNLTVDLWQFEDAVEKMRQFASLSGEGLMMPPSLQQEIVYAAGLWRGEGFIESGDMYISPVAERWWQDTNRVLQNDKLILFKTIARVESEMQNFSNALFWLKKILKLDEYDEEGNYLYLYALSNLHQNKKGHQHYLSIREDFGEDWGGKYKRKIDDLGKKLATENIPKPKQVRLEWSLKSSIQAPFVGQDDALAKLKRQFLRGGVALIFGETGVGKTRLVQQFYEMLEAPPEFLGVSCRETERHIPYLPVKGALAQLISEDIWLKMRPDLAATLANLMPENLRSLRDDLGGEDESASYTQNIVFEAVRELLLALSQDTPMIFFIDNAQWADEASLALFSYLVKSDVFEKENQFLIIASQPVGSNSELNKFSPRRANTLLRFDMHPLNEEDIKALGYYILQEHISSSTAHHLQRQTGGNAYFILELFMGAWALPERGKMMLDSPTPPSIQILIRDRLERLSREARELLQLAAVQGDPFEFSLLEKAADLPLSVLTELIEELEEARLIRADQQQETIYYLFNHSRTHTEVFASIPAARKRLFHRKVANALQEMHEAYPDSYAAVLAEHYEKAGEYSLAFEQWILAAKYDYQFFSIEDAFFAYKRAEALLDKQAFSDEAIHRLYAPWGFMLYQSDDPDRLEILMENLLAKGRKRGSALLIGAALDGLSDVHMARNEFEEGLERTTTALGFLEGTGHVLALMQALIHQGTLLYMQGDFKTSAASFMRALELGAGKESSETYFMLGFAQYNISAILTGRGLANEALPYANEALRLMRLARVPSGVALPLSMISLAHCYLGNYSKGREFGMKSLETSIQTDSSRFQGYSYAYVAFSETELPDIGLAWQNASKAVEIGESRSHTEIASMGYRSLGDICTHLEAYAKAQEFYKKGVEIDKKGFVTTDNLARQGLVLYYLGEPQGEELLQMSLNITDEFGAGCIHWPARAQQLALFAHKRDLENYAKNLPVVEKVFHDEFNPNTVILFRYLDALTALYADDLPKTLSILEKTLPALENTPFFWTKLSILKLYAYTLRALGQKTEEPLKEIEAMLRQVEATLGDAPLRREWDIFALKTRDLEFDLI